MCWVQTTTALDDFTGVSLQQRSEVQVWVEVQEFTENIWTLNEELKTLSTLFVFEKLKMLDFFLFFFFT